MSTFALFIALRAGDQLRAQVACTRLNVKLMGGYAGLSDFADGASHQSVEDLAVVRAVPNIVVVAPSDIRETRLAVRAAVEHEGPVFVRLSRAEITEDYGPDHPFELGKAVMLRDGRDVTLAATGITVRMAMRAAEMLGEEDVEARVLDVHTVKPLDVELLTCSAEETGALVTVEEHNVAGGFGGAVCEELGQRCPVPVLRVGVPDRFGESGPYEQILRRAGIHPEAVAGAARRAIAMK